MSDDLPGPSDFVNEAYALNDKESILAFYRKWAGEYDEQMASTGYISPRDIARMLADHLPEREAEILDIGCGTGLTGHEVAAYGFTALDGMDISGEMVAVARSRDIYRRLLVGDLNQPLAIPDESYAAVISSGTFTHGHVGPEPLPEIFRTLKPNGILACTVHFDLWHSRGFDAKFAELMTHGVADCVALTEGPYFDGGDNEGWFCVYRKLPQQETNTGS